MPEEYVKGYCLKLNEEEAESLKYLKNNGFNIHKIVKNYITEKAKLLRKENDRIAKELAE